MPTRRNAQSEGESGEWRQVVPAPAPAPAPVPAPVVFGDDDDESEPGDRIAALIREAGPQSETTVRVYRRLPNSVKYAWCVNYTASEFLGGDLGMIREQWGPGEYSLRVYGGQRGIIAREDVVIAPSATGAAATNPALAISSQRSELTIALERMAEQQAALIAALSNRPDPMQAMQGAIAMMRDMREAMGVPSHVPAPAPSPTAMLTEIIGAVRSLREVSDEINPKPAGDPDNPMALLPGVIELIKSAVQNQGQAGSVPQIAAPPSLQYKPNPAPVAASAVPVDHQPQGQDMGMLVMRGIMEETLAMKARGDSIEKVAEYLAEKLPDEILPYLELPNWFDIASTFAPNLREHEAWVRDVAASCIALLNSESNSTPPT